MKDAIPDIVEKGRVKTGPWSVTMRNTGIRPSDGSFMVRTPWGVLLGIISTTGEGWEHVSVSCSDRTPVWREMCFVKDLFWRDDEVVMQLHVAKSEHVNYNPYCLHLWRPTDATIPLPPSEFVGPKLR